MTSPSRRTTPNSQRPTGKRSGTGTISRRPAPTGSFLARNRGRLVWAVGGVAILVMAGLAFLNATSPAYACANEWQTPETAPPAPSATPRLGYIQDDLGREHVSVGSFVRFALCPPASGKHVNQRTEGPIEPGVFGPDDKATPQGWIHNLEHGGLVVLYRCPGDACTDAGLAEMKALFARFPAGPVCGFPAGVNGPIFARFDEMAWPVAALLWGEVMPLEAFDAERILAYWAQDGERYHPERAGCPAATPTPGPSATVTPSATPAPSPTSVPSATPAPTETPAPSAS